MPPPPTKPSHLPALDGLRGIAILAVVAFHVAVMATRDAPWLGEQMPPLALWPVFAGKLGVDVFFVLSGFLVLRSWQKMDGDFVSFARRRALRILPAYWFSLLILIPWRASEWGTSFEGLRKIVMFATVQQFLEPELPHQVNVVTWSLTTEVHFYLLLPLLVFTMRRYGWRALLGGLAVVSIGWRIVTGGTGEEAEWILGRADQFAAGMAAASVVASRDKIVSFLRSRPGAIALTIAGIAAALPLGTFQMLGKPLAYEATFHSIFGVVVAGTLVRLATSERRFPVMENPVMRGLGVVSYSLFLWHWPLLIEASARWGPSAPVLAGALGVTAIATALSYRFLERPFLRPVTKPTAVEDEARVPLSSARRLAGTRSAR